jgi:hypothetical protein
MSRVCRSTAPCCCPRGVFRLGLHESSDSATVLMLARPVYCNFDLSLGAPGWAGVCSQVPVPGEVRPQDQRVSDVKDFVLWYLFSPPHASGQVSCILQSLFHLVCSRTYSLGHIRGTRFLSSHSPAGDSEMGADYVRWLKPCGVFPPLGCPCVSLRALSCATRACVLPPADLCPCPEFAAPSHRTVTPTRVNREDFVLSRIPSLCLPSVCCLVATRACVLPLPNPRPVPPRPVPPHAHLSRA